MREDLKDLLSTWVEEGKEEIAKEHEFMVTVNGCIEAVRNEAELQDVVKSLANCDCKIVIYELKAELDNTIKEENKDD